MLPRKFLFSLALMFAGPLTVIAPLAAQQSLPAPQVPLGCTRVPVPADHLFTGLFAHQGDTLVNVLPETGTGEPLTAIRVTIAPGDQPITALLSGRRVVWDFAGDVARVQRVLVLAQDSPMAVKGIARERVEFPAAEICRMGKVVSTREEIDTLKFTFPFLFGRALDVATLDDSIHEVRLPTGEVAKPNRDRRDAASHELYWFYPGGVLEFDLATLVSSVPLIVPEVLPDMAGLRQLEQSGAIRAPTREEVAAWNEGASRPYRSKLSPNYRMRVPFDYAITREIAMPAGLHGAHSRKFLVLSGVPAPRGSPGHSCVARMDTFSAGDTMLCHGDEREAIERLGKLPPPEALADCRAVDVPADAAIEAVSAYEPASASHSFGSKRVPAPIHVQVRRSGNVVLVLNTYEPAIWRVTFTPDTRIAAVLLTGYYKSEVEGIHPDTPVIATDHEGRAQRPKPSRRPARRSTAISPAHTVEGRARCCSIVRSKP
ncbi:MAG: hypothetical protein QOF14_2484 [Hyphomicrobiales bacterium]|jgi:hypothetical protein|nr:hypothetical protein [Hyphomicrobiales bacterium]